MKVHCHQIKPRNQIEPSSHETDGSLIFPHLSDSFYLIFKSFFIVGRAAPLLQRTHRLSLVATCSGFSLQHGHWSWQASEVVVHGLSSCGMLGLSCPAAVES